MDQSDGRGGNVDKNRPNVVEDNQAVDSHGWFRFRRLFASRWATQYLLDYFRIQLYILLWHVPSCAVYYVAVCTGLHADRYALHPTIIHHEYCSQVFSTARLNRCFSYTSHCDFSEHAIPPRQCLACRLAHHFSTARARNARRSKTVTMGPTTNS